MTYKPRKLGQIDPVLGLWLEFTSSTLDYKCLQPDQVIINSRVCQIIFRPDKLCTHFDQLLGQATKLNIVL